MLLGCSELNGASPYVLIPAASMFLFGRYLHSIGLGVNMNNRVNGMRITLYSILAFSGLNLFLIGKKYINM